jgi:hypothetical protein
MGYEAKKTEHSGPKRGNGAYWVYRWDAKKESNRVRRENAKREVRAGAADAALEESIWEPQVAVEIPETSNLLAF